MKLASSSLHICIYAAHYINVETELVYDRVIRSFNVGRPFCFTDSGMA